MGCERMEELLSPYLEDELTEGERQTVQTHIRTCASCAELLSLMRETKESLSFFPEVDMSESLIGKLYELPQKRKKFRFVTDFLLRPSFQPIMAAVTVLLVFVSFYAFHPERSAINRSIERQFKIGFSKVEKLYAEAESITHTLGEYKDNLFVSIKNLKPFRGNEDEQPNT
ncbi:MAG: zf-HC2 domain-containing protein [Candidatus Aminicenantes bacterium]|nr:MAG: zf-HC2 domain-containing protein [Candidatus Aminicenantes bacterium]